MQYVCNQCGSINELIRYEFPKIELKGFYPHTLGGILIPDNCREFHFCEHKCFVKWCESWIKNEKE